MGLCSLPESTIHGDLAWVKCTFRKPLQADFNVGTAQKVWIGLLDPPLNLFDLVPVTRIHGIKLDEVLANLDAVKISPI